MRNIMQMVNSYATQQMITNENLTREAAVGQDVYYCDGKSRSKNVKAHPGKWWVDVIYERGNMNFVVKRH